MALLLNLETATTNCSVSVSKDNEIIVLKENNAINYSHSEQLHIFIKEALQEASLSFSDLDAVAISKGPGSYTGLRIGVSAAKGLCFSLDIPLISIPTLKSMACQFNPKEEELENISTRVLGNQDEVKRLSEQLMSQKLLDLYKEKANLKVKEVSYDDFIKEAYS